MAVVEKLLKQIGVPADKIKEVLAAEKEEKADFDVEPIVTSFKDNQRALFENDSELAEKFASRERGKLLDIWTSKAKKLFGIPSELVKDKKFDEVLEIAKAEATKSMSKDLQALQEEALAAANKVKEYEEQIIPGIKAEVVKEKKMFTIKNKITGMIPTDKLRVPAGTVEKIVNADILSAYDLDIDDKGEVVLFEKGKQIHAKAPDGTKLLTLADAMQHVMKENKFIKESNADDGGDNGGQGGQQQKKVLTQEEKAKLSPGALKALEHQERLAAEAKARAERGE